MTEPRQDEFVAEEAAAKAEAGRIATNGTGGDQQQAHVDLPWDAADDFDRPIKPREWLLGTEFCRGFISILTAVGGTGKTALRMVQFLSMVTCRALSGDHCWGRFRVLVICLEDGRDELRRRVRAAAKHHGVSKEELRDYLFLWTPRGLKLAKMREGSREVIPAELASQIRDFVILHKIDLVSIDPWVKAHGVEENDNNAVDAVCVIFATLAEELNIAADATHHENKLSSEPGDSRRGRGASAMRDAGRLVKNLTPMTSDEAARFNLADHERRAIFRLDNAKVNIAPATAETRWFRLIGVPIGNATAGYPAGDNVQTVEPWVPPDFWRSISSPVANQILDIIDKGLTNGRRYSGAPQARGERRAGLAVQAVAPNLNETQAGGVIAEWLKNGVIETRGYRDPTQSRDENGLFVNPSKRPT